MVQFYAQKSQMFYGDRIIVLQDYLSKFETQDKYIWILVGKAEEQKGRVGSVYKNQNVQKYKIVEIT